MNETAEKAVSFRYPKSFPLRGAKRGLVVNECPVGIQIQTVTEPAGEKVCRKAQRRWVLPCRKGQDPTSSVSHSLDSFPSRGSTC